jgi:hypothetical protein
MFLDFFTRMSLFESYLKIIKLLIMQFFSGILRPFVLCFKNSPLHFDRKHLRFTSLRDGDTPNSITTHSNTSKNIPHLHPHTRSFLERFWRHNKPASLAAEVLRDASGDVPLQYRQPVLTAVSISKSQSQLCRDGIVWNYTWIHFVCLYYQDSKFREKLGRGRRGSLCTVFVRWWADRLGST